MFSFVHDDVYTLQASFSVQVFHLIRHTQPSYFWSQSRFESPSIVTESYRPAQSCNFSVLLRRLEWI